MKQKNYIMKKNNDIIKQPMKNINTMKIMKKFLFLKIFFLALYSPTIFAITCSTGSGGSSGSYSWSTATDSADFKGIIEHSSVIFDNKMWVLGGYSLETTFPDFTDKAWSSDDGVTWDEETKDSSKKFTKRRQHSSVVFDDDGNGDKIWIMGGLVVGRSNDVWSSTNGATWTRVRLNGAAEGFGARNRHTSVVFDKKMWILGGILNSGEAGDAWSSTNGKTWEEETKDSDSSEKFPIRYDHTSVVFDDGNGEKIWVIGGYTFVSGSVVPLNDVWSSKDGKTWTEVTKDSSKKFTARGLHESVVFDNQMWVIAGANDGNNLKNDVWRSTDGKDWTRVTDNAEFTARDSSAAVLFENRVWLIGGKADTTTFLNDVWSMKRD